MKTKSRISPWQVFVLLMLGRIMYSMLYQARNFTSGTPMMLGQLLATIIEAIIAIPLLAFLSYGEPLAESISPKSAVQAIIKGGFAIYFTVLFSMMLAGFAAFMHNQFSVVGSPITVIIILALASAYCASLGLEGIARAAGIVFWCVIVLVVSMALLSEGEPNWLYLQPMTKGDIATMLEYMNESRGSSWWLPMLASISGNLKKDSWRAGIWYLVGKLVFVELLIFAVTVILWRFVDVPGYPILALGAYAKTDFVQRFDAVNMFVWTLNCVIVGGSYLYSSSGVGEKKRKICIWLFALAAVALAAIEYYLEVPLQSGLAVAFRGWGTLILGMMLPLIAIITIKRRRKCA